MDQRKSRAKRKTGSGWVVGDYQECGTIHYINYATYADFAPRIRFTSAEVIPETVGRYIGIKDKDNTDMCQGDIVEGKKDDGFDQDVRGVIGYQGMAFSIQGKKADGSDWFFTITSECRKCDILKVVGDRFDNPELLESVEYVDKKDSTSDN